MSRQLTSGVLGSREKGHPNLLAGWNFDNNFEDISGNNVVLTEEGTAHTFTDGYRNKAVVNTLDNNFIFNNPGILTTTDLITICAWVYPTGTNRAGIVSSGVASQFLGQNTLERIHAYVNTTTVQGPVDTLPANTWSHIAAVWDGSLYSLYVNSVLIASAASGGYNSIFDLWDLGRAALNNSRRWVGMFQEVYIFNKAMVPLELTEIASTPLK